MTRTVVILLLLIAAFAVALAPATLLRQLIAADSTVDLTGLSGTLWRGSAGLSISGRDAGTLTWRLTPASILHGALGFHLDLTGPQQALAGDVQLHPAGFEAALEGSAGGTFFNAWLQAYDIELSGDFALVAAQVQAPWDIDRDAGLGAAPGSAAGTLTWTGGPVRYRLAAREYAGLLPPLEARIGPGMTAVVVAPHGAEGAPEAPLLRLELLANGFVRVGMTRLMTRMLNNPWPGADTDHEVVLEVEEQLL